MKHNVQQELKPNDRMNFTKEVKYINPKPKIGMLCPRISANLFFN